MSFSIRRVRELLRKELRQMFRDPKMKRILFVAPIIQLVAFGYAVNTDIKHTATFVVDHDASAASRELIDVIESTGYFRVIGRSDRSSDLVRVLDRGAAIVGIEIPPRFARDMSSGGGARVQVVLDGTESNAATVAQGYLNRIIQRFAFEKARVRDGLQGGLDLRSRAWYNPELESRAYNVPGVIGMLMLLMSLLLSSMSVVREREMGTLDQLNVSPLSPIEFMFGKTIPAAMVCIMDLVVITAIAVLWFHIPMRGSFLVLLLAALIFVVSGLSLGLLISSVSKTQQEAFMSTFLILMPTILLSGFFYPIASMPRVFQWITIVNPLRHFLEIVRPVFLKGAGITELLPQFSGLVIFAGAAMWLAVTRFHKNVAT